ncbi:DUF1203 domain-containing protein [Pseudoalteromonas byunsanensis]|uniref:DUF1203 domain-containing protein n=1 Tax=Pseudoalteromonas byunsanensis TaxID=327939 RepID=A0A1S1N6F5_9GAMM|nr:DUF1203 domain-containing protein [Pseudoalteromonas byunsanensis]OHU94943.1 hypothetical protein BIW53_13065 [Pseudoalteromonas byunsanensis]
MTSKFRFVALKKEQFDSYMELSDEELAIHHAKWMIVDKEPGYPCRVSLEDAKIGERVLFIPYWHHDVQSAYRAMGTILVRERARNTQFEVNQVPTMLHHRFLSVKVYDSSNMMIAHDLAKGSELEVKLRSQFQNPNAAYIHLHYASPGCFCSAVYRA